MIWFNHLPWQDGGAGSVGEIVGPVGDNWVSVQWLDNRFSNSYRCGVEGEFDLTKHDTNRYQKAMMGISAALVGPAEGQNVVLCGSLSFLGS